jgi:hypothetical protein
MAIGSNPLSSTTKFAQIDVISFAARIARADYPVDAPRPFRRHGRTVAHLQ